MERLRLLLKRIPVLNEVLSRFHDVRRIEIHLRTLHEILLAQRELLRMSLLSHPKYDDPRRLNKYELQCFSQNGEHALALKFFVGSVQIPKCSPSLARRMASNQHWISTLAGLEWVLV
jgi:hypothetical protein